MLFNTPPFVVLFFVFFIVYHFALRTTDQKLWFIAICSIAFYATWTVKFVPILIGTGVLDYLVARALGAESDPRKRKWLVTASVAMNLGVLAYFKYAQFFVDSVAAGLNAIGVHVKGPALSIMLPLGISFYTFQSISYTVDVYRGTFPARKRLLEFVASLTFFPHLVAGPIVRASKLMPQLNPIRGLTRESALRGIMLVGAGAAKKTIADLLVPVVDDFYSAHNAHSVLSAWTASLGFSAQVYADFAGYTDIAIGLALLLGISLPPNFNLPYLATSPLDFWKRWHISLSSWLHDYLYYPMFFRYRDSPYLCLFITWVLAGLWHGAGWLFLVYGIYHACLLVGTRWLAERTRWTKKLPSRLFRTWQIAFTFYLVTVGCVFFRSQSMHQALEVLRDLHHSQVASRFTVPATITLALVIVALVVSHAIDALVIHRQKALQRNVYFWPFIVACFYFSFTIGTAAQPFIYFHF